MNTNSLNSILIEGLVTDIRNIPGPNKVVQMDLQVEKDGNSNRFFVNACKLLAEKCAAQVEPGKTRVRVVGTLSSNGLGTAVIDADHVEFQVAARIILRLFRVQVAVNYTIDVEACNQDEAIEEAVNEVVNNGNGDYETYTVGDVDIIE